ncbi:MAG: dihydroorotase, partial [Gammaproteobacteria bacterium]|nr:dihydroorotase [Gammaproteobacteria bacterium]
MSKLLIKNARLVNEGLVQDADVLLKDDRIARIGPDLSLPSRARLIDANGKFLLPGMIDDQVHFREPGMTHKGDLATESAAAAAGG